MPPELVTFMDAVHGDHPTVGVTASLSDFPDLAVAPPLSLTTDEQGWYRLTVNDAVTRTTASGYVRRTWAKARTLEVLGVNRSGFDLRRRR